MSDMPDSFWSDDTSVFFSSYWGWTPETWGCVGWSGNEGLTRRTNLLGELTDPFIAAVYVTKSADAEDDERGKVVGFYLMSHETGVRNDFTHPKHHDLEPGKWDHSLRALRGFTYLPEHRIDATEVVDGLNDRALAVAKWGEILSDRKRIDLLRAIPWVETNVYTPAHKTTEFEDEVSPLSGFTRAGPANRNGYVVSTNAHDLKRQLYILRLSGKTDDYLGKQASGGRIYKIGLSVSPELRRQALQSALPRGSFRWEIHRRTGGADHEGGFSFLAAVAGEDAMKRYLAQNAEWLGGEFYLAQTTEINEAWQVGHEAASQFKLS